MREQRWAGLDGLRAVAIVAVLGTHFGFFGPIAVIGVDLFFVISGFLITWLLLRERTGSGSVALGAFWTRRALRLLPALACAMAFACAMATMASPALRHETMSGLPWVTFYLANWHMAAHGGQGLGLLAHTWSLSIEEQFYLFWPLIVTLVAYKAIRSRHAVAVILGILAATDMVYFFWAMNHWGGAYYRTDTHAMGLLAGCALAFVVNHDGRVPVLGGEWERRAQAAATGALVIFAVLCVSQRGRPIMMVGGTLASIILVTGIVLAPMGTLTRLLSTRGPVWIGRRSYGIYLYHYPLALVFVGAHRFHGIESAGAVAICIAASLLLAAASYRWIELPFLRLKSRVAPGSKNAMPVVPDTRAVSPLSPTSALSGASSQ
jgi:peptidoglycan/LPS O-acetylase OafA/YrhL